MRTNPIRTIAPALALVAALALSACISVPQSPAPTPSPPTAASSPAAFEVRAIEIGDWARESPQAIQARFARSVERAVGRGETIPEALAALQASQFGCNPVTGRGGDERPVQLCERQIRQSGCTHTWQVTLFDPGRQGRASSAEAVYDRVCSGETGPGGGLLGAPPG